MTKVSKCNLEIYEATDHPSFIDGLLVDYWTFDDVEKDTYKFTLKELAEKYNKKQSQISPLLTKQGYVKVNTMLACHSCTKDIVITKRSELNETDNWNNPRSVRFCIDCYKKDLNNKIHNILNKMKCIYPDNLLENIDDIDSNLSYIEKLLLLILMISPDINHEDIKEHEWNNFIQIEINSSYEIINNLIDKKYIYAPRYNKTFQDLRDELYLIIGREKDYIDNHIYDEMYEVLSKLNNAFIRVPKQYKSIDEFSSYLFNELPEHEISLFDIKQIEHYVKNKRISKITSIFEKTCKEKRIPYKIDNSMQVVFASMANCYNLKQCNNIINYRSKFVIDSINTAKIQGKSHYEMNYYFRNNLMNFLSYLEQEKSRPIYETKLDDSWVISETESFVSAHIIKDNKFWITLTVPIIVANWISALENNLKS